MVYQDVVDQIRGRFMRARGTLPYAQRGTLKIEEDVGVKRQRLQRFLNGKDLTQQEMQAIERWCNRVLNPRREVPAEYQQAEMVLDEAWKIIDL